MTLSPLDSVHTLAIARLKDQDRIRACLDVSVVLKTAQLSLRIFLPHLLGRPPVLCMRAATLLALAACLVSLSGRETKGTTGSGTSSGRSTMLGGHSCRHQLLSPADSFEAGRQQQPPRGLSRLGKTLMAAHRSCTCHLQGFAMAATLRRHPAANARPPIEVPQPGVPSLAITATTVRYTAATMTSTVQAGFAEDIRNLGGRL